MDAFHDDGVMIHTFSFVGCEQTAGTKCDEHPLVDCFLGCGARRNAMCWMDITVCRSDNVINAYCVGWTRFSQPG